MSVPIKVGLNIVVVAPERLVEVARSAEALGYESLWSGEHVALPFEMQSPYPGEDPPFRPDSIFVEPLVMLSHLAAVTSRIRLGVGIYLLPLRDPILAGRAIATLDVLSGGRLDLGIGIGWCEEEFRFVGREFRKRGQLVDEVIDALDVLFTEARPEFHGQFFDFPPIGFEPKPVQRPRPKFHIGGFGPAAFRRAALRGDGFYGAGGSPRQVQPIIESLREERKKAGREAEPFEISLISLGDPPTRELLQGYSEIGVDRVVVTPWQDGTRVPHPGEISDNALEAVERYAKAVGLAS